MKFSLPELPDEQKENATPASQDKNAIAGSYDALMAKLGRRVSADAGKVVTTVDNLFPAKDADKDDGFDGGSDRIDELEAAVPEQVSGVTKLLANLLSWIMVPLLMPVVSMTMLIWLTPLRQMTMTDKVIALLITVGFNTILPMILIGVLKLIGVVQDVGLNRRRERPIPYIITITGLVITVVFLRMQGAEAWLWGTYVGAAVASVVCCIVNFRWKISAHATGAAGVIGTMVVIGVTGNAIVNIQWWLFGACLLTGLVGSARVYLCRHSYLQVIAGYVCGFCSILLTALLINSLNIGGV